MTLRDLPYTTKDLFPNGDFAFHMKFRRGEIEAFYRNQDHPGVLSERRKWLTEAPGKYVGAGPGSEPVIQEAVKLARSLGVQVEPGASMRDLGMAWEPDILLLRAPSPNAQPELVAGAVCFPSSWALEEKMGKSLDVIHGPVPTLNEQFASPVQQFLARMKPGISWERINWGLSRSLELNQHPSLELPRLDASVNVGDVWFRSEYQSLVALPESGGILFGIRLVIEPLAKLLHSAEFVEGMQKAMRTMPESIARYKGLAAARERLLELLVFQGDDRVH